MSYDLKNVLKDVFGFIAMVTRAHKRRLSVRLSDRISYVTAVKQAMHMQIGSGKHVCRLFIESQYQP